MICCKNEPKLAVVSCRVVYSEENVHLHSFSCFSSIFWKGMSPKLFLYFSFPLSVLRFSFSISVMSSSSSTSRLFFFCVAVLSQMHCIIFYLGAPSNSSFTANSSWKASLFRFWFIQERENFQVLVMNCRDFAYMRI